MAEPSPYPDPGERPGTPGWVKVFGIIVLLAVLLLVIVLLVGGGHGPRRHTSSVGASEWHVAADLSGLSERHQ